MGHLPQKSAYIQNVALISECNTSPVLHPRLPGLEHGPAEDLQKFLLLDQRNARSRNSLFNGPQRGQRFRTVNKFLQSLRYYLFHRPHQSGEATLKSLNGPKGSHPPLSPGDSYFVSHSIQIQNYMKSDLNIQVEERMHQ